MSWCNCSSSEKTWPPILERGRTPLPLAAWGGGEAVVRLLVEREDVAPDTQDKGGQTPLSLATEGGHDYCCPTTNFPVQPKKDFIVSCDNPFSIHSFTSVDEESRARNPARTFYYTWCSSCYSTFIYYK
jgi:hypothetical protein